MKANSLRAALIIAGVILLAPSLVGADTTASIQPGTSTVSVGDTLILNVDISNVTDLFAWQFDITFNPSVLSATSISEGSVLQPGGTTFFVPGTIDNVDGTVLFNADSLIGSGPGVNGSGILATIDFLAIGSGISSVDLTNNIFLDSASASITVSLERGTVDVTGAIPTPEPESRILVLLGIFLFSVLRVCGFGVHSNRFLRHRTSSTVEIDGAEAANVLSSYQPIIEQYHKEN